MKYYEGIITTLKDDEVFVFGSNTFGFHGAGAAGYATFNEMGNVWRKYEYDKKPDGWRGCWTVKGIGEGFQEGRIGKSYAIPTVTKAGAKKSLSIAAIIAHILKFHTFYEENPQYKYYVAQTAQTGLNGWDSAELMIPWVMQDWDDNIFFEKSFYDLMVKSEIYNIYKNFRVCNV
jgi:hypothetical protein